MTKKELIDKIAIEFDLNKGEADKQCSFIFEEIQKTLLSGEEVAINGFGKFVTQVRPAREGVNPKSGEKIKIAETKVVKFKVAKALKDEIAGKKI